MVRDWGDWTVIKLEALEGYFSAFTTAAKYKAPHTLYLDLFGGRPDNRQRSTQQVFPGSSVRAAQANPPFAKLIVSELNEGAASTLRARLEQLVGARATVLAGDCNVVIPEALRRLSGSSYLRWGCERHGLSA